MKLGIHYVWFKLALAIGSLLGLLLLVQSIVTYYQVSRSLVIAELQREAGRQVDSLWREARQLGIRDPAKLGDALKTVRQEASGKIAWIRLIDREGKTLLQEGNPVGQAPATNRAQPAFPGGPLPPDIRTTPGGRVLVTRPSLMPGRRLFGEPGTRGPNQQPNQRTSQQPSQEPGRGPIPGQEQGQGPMPGQGPAVPNLGARIEIALYLNSVSATFGPLLSNVIVSCLAALGLVASMILLWFRFPGYVRGKQLERQTELARRVQMDLLPPADSTFKELDFAAECVPAWQVGGDFYDIFSTDHGRIALVLGDVSGKGLPASVVVGLLLGAVRASGWLGGSTEHEASTRRLSELLRTRTSLERFASLFWCYYEPETRILRYVNAGHLPPMVVRRSGSGEIKNQRLEEGGPVLGVVPAAEYRQGMTAVSSGDLLVLYSDGVVEATNASDEQFGEERVFTAIRDNWARSSAEIRDSILQTVHAFLDKEPAQDDLTLVVVRIRG